MSNAIDDVLAERRRQIEIEGWPKSWSRSWWKPKSPRRDLVRAAALLIAEIERVDRAVERGEEASPVSNHRYRCGVANCGNGQCVHKLLDTKCPNCGSNMVQVTTTGHEFCSNDQAFCDYEVNVKEVIE